MTPPDPSRRSGGSPWASSPKPAVLAALPESRQVHLDVRQEIRDGREPLARIMAAVRSLAAGQVLLLRAPFEPAPLYDVLGRRGFAHWTERHGPDDWAVWFYRADEAAAAPGPETAAPAAGASAPAGVLSVDVRGLEPPLPMVRVLEGLDALGPGETLEVLHDRRPMFLYPQLEDRGFTHDTDEPAPGVVRILIRRKAPAS